MPTEPRRSWKHAGASAAWQEIARTIQWRRVSAGHYVGNHLLRPSAPVYRIDRHASGSGYCWTVQVYDGTWAEKPLPDNPADLHATNYIGDEHRTLNDAKAAAEKFEASR